MTCRRGEDCDRQRWESIFRAKEGTVVGKAWKNAWVTRAQRATMTGLGHSIRCRKGSGRRSDWKLPLEWTEEKQERGKQRRPDLVIWASGSGHHPEQGTAPPSCHHYLVGCPPPGVPLRDKNNHSPEGQWLIVARRAASGASCVGSGPAALLTSPVTLDQSLCFSEASVCSSVRWGQ